VVQSSKTKVVLISTPPSTRSAVAEWYIHPSSKGKVLFLEANQSQEPMRIPVEDVLSITQGADLRVWINVSRTLYERTGWVSELIGSNRAGRVVVEKNFEAFLASVNVIKEEEEGTARDEVDAAGVPISSRSRKVLNDEQRRFLYGLPEMTFLYGLPEMTALMLKIGAPRLVIGSQVKGILSAMSGSKWVLGLVNLDSGEEEQLPTFKRFQTLLDYDNDPQLLTVVSDLAKTNLRLFYEETV